MIKTFNLNLENLIDDYFHFICFPSYGSSYNYFLTKIWIWIDSSLYSFIPFLVMVSCSILIWLEIRIKTRNLLIRSRSNVNHKFERNRQLLIMLTVTNAYFIFCSFPYFVAYYKLPPNENLHSIFYLLAYSKNSINFVFFFLFSFKYRQTLSSLVFREPAINANKNRFKAFKNRLIKNKNNENNNETAAQDISLNVLSLNNHLECNVLRENDASLRNRNRLSVDYQRDHSQLTASLQSSNLSINLNLSGVF